LTDDRMLRPGVLAAERLLVSVRLVPRAAVVIPPRESS